MQAEEYERSSADGQAGRLSAWLPMLLVVGSFSLSWLPSQDALLNALLVGLYLTYTAAVTGLHILPRISDRLS